jgi:hypothetical protein
VDDAHQIIIAADLTQETNDKLQLVPMFAKVRENMGRLPEKASADCGYFSEAAVTHPSLAQVDLYVPPGRQKHGQDVPNPEDEPADEPPSEPEKLSVAEKMRRKLGTPAGHAVYKMRKAIVEPVFGQIKQVRGFRQFLLRGLANGSAEWLLICAMHNLLKMFRSGRKLQLAAV